jgi:hypothetical protein
MQSEFVTVPTSGLRIFMYEKAPRVFPAPGERRSSADGASSTAVVFTPVVPIDFVESAASPNVESPSASAQHGKNVPWAVALESEVPAQLPGINSAATGASFLKHTTGPLGNPPPLR